MTDRNNKKYQKTLDKGDRVCYNSYRTRKRLSKQLQLNSRVPSLDYLAFVHYTTRFWIVNEVLLLFEKGEYFVEILREQKRTAYWRA